MAITFRQAFPWTQYPWGYQVRFELQGETGRIYNGEGVWNAPPTQEQIDAKVAERIAQVEAELNPPIPIPEYHIICEDGAVIDL